MGKQVLKKAIELILSPLVAIILIIWGIPGMVEDLNTWVGWLGDIWNWLSKTPTIISWILVIMGLLILFQPLRLFKRKRGIEQLSSKASEAKTEWDKVEKKPRIFSALNMLSNQYTHKCSQCGWGVVVNKYDTGVVCPKCGNADDIYNVRL